MIDILKKHLKGIQYLAAVVISLGGAALVIGSSWDFLHKEQLTIVQHSEPKSHEVYMTISDFRASQISDKIDYHDFRAKELASMNSNGERDRQIHVQNVAKDAWCINYKNLTGEADERC